MQKKGISLIVLVITIIVMIILAVTIVLSLSSAGIINKANMAVEQMNTKEVQNLASIAWSEGYLNKLRGEDLEKYVLEQLKDYTDKYTINVNDKGVVVMTKQEKASGFIAGYDAAEFANRPKIDIDGMVLVKYSDYIPTEEELRSVSMTIEYLSERLSLKCTEIINLTGIIGAVYQEVPVLSVSVAGAENEFGINFPEPGFYAPDITILSGNEDISCVFSTKMKVSLSGKNLTFDRINGADAYEIYVKDELVTRTTGTTVDISNYINHMAEGYIKVRAIISETNIASEYTYIWYSNGKEEPGLYDSNDNLIATWSELVNDYGMDISYPYNRSLESDGYTKIPTSPYCVFSSNPELAVGTKLIVGYGTTIGTYAFADCDNLKSIYLPDTITSIGQFAFRTCDSLTEVVIGENSKLETIGREIFRDTENIKYTEYKNGQYYGTSNNPYMILVQAIDTNANTFEIHPNTKIIASYSLSWTAIRNIIIPEGIESIDYWAFYKSDINTITLPSTLKCIYSGAFDVCYSLSTIIFNGTVEQWNSIYLVEGWNEDIAATQVQCINGTVEI